MQFRQVKNTVQVLMSVYDKETKRTRQRMVMSFPFYGSPEKVTADQLSGVTDDRLQATLDEINAWLADRSKARQEGLEKRSAFAANRALQELVGVLEGRPEALSEGDLDSLAETLRIASKAVANRRRSFKMSAKKKADSQP